MKGDVPEVRVIVTASDAAELLGLARQTVNKRLLRGDYKSAMRLGPRLYVLRRDEIDAILSGRHEKYTVPKKNEVLL